VALLRSARSPGSQGRDSAPSRGGLLRVTALAAAQVALLLSCHEQSAEGRVLAERFDDAVWCDDNLCFREHTSDPTTGALLDGYAFVTEAEDGTQVYGELPYAGGIGYLEIERDGDETSVLYVEREGRRETFRSERARGVLEVPGDALGTCWCETARFELRLEDPGEDGVLDTDDDLVRHLGLGRYTRGDELCLPEARFAIGDELTVERPERCPDVVPPPTPGAPPPTPGDPPPPTYEETSVTCDGSGCSGSSSGCGGSSGDASCEGDSSASCEGDGSSSSSCSGDGGSGCGGDSSSTCEGDAAGVAPACRTPRGGCGAGIRDGRLQFLFFMAIVLFDLQRRARLIRV